jgi:hypothetical protein
MVVRRFGGVSSTFKVENAAIHPRTVPLTGISRWFSTTGNKTVYSIPSGHRKKRFVTGLATSSPEYLTTTLNAQLKTVPLIPIFSIFKAVHCASLAYESKRFEFQPLLT